MHALNQFLQCQHSLFLSASRLADFLNVNSQGDMSSLLEFKVILSVTKISRFK